MKLKSKHSKNHLSFNLVPTLGMLMMSVASIAGFFEYSDHGNLTIGKSIVLPTQTVLSKETELNDDASPIAREKDEVSSEYVSYSEVQRTAPRSATY